MHHFRSRVSVILVVVIAMSLLPVIFFQEPGTEANDIYVAYGVMILFIAMLVLFLFGMRYEIGERFLIVKAGPIPLSKIKIDEITSIQRTYNPLSSPASSLKRLYVRSKSKDVIISPADEKEFVRLLQARNPNITVAIKDANGWWRFWDWDI